MRDGDRRSVTYKEIMIYFILPPLFVATGFFLSDINAEVKKLREEKISRTELYRIVDSIEKKFDSKTDMIIELLRQHESNSRKRNN